VGEVLDGGTFTLQSGGQQHITRINELLAYNEIKIAIRWGLVVRQLQNTIKCNFRTIIDARH
jgi:hypothetical protein